MPPQGSLERISAEPQECAELARRFGLPALHSLDAELKVSRWRGEGLKIKGRFTADLDQTCVVSLEIFRSRLADGYLNDPIVSLTIAEINSLTLSISGMVSKTGAVKFTPGITITEVIAQSGGFTPMARKNMVKVTRMLNGVKQTYKLPVERIAEGERPNFPMLPGDEVFVPERPW